MNKLSILVTGGCGFIGSNLCIRLKERYPHYQILALDNLKRRGSELNVSRLVDQGVLFIHGDIRCADDLEIAYQFDYIIDAAAEPSVLAGVGSPLNYVINTNLNGTINSLALAVKHKAKFIFLSTSRVYPIQELERICYQEEETRFQLSDNQTKLGVSDKGINEHFPLTGARSIYGTTKLASEFLLEEYKAFFNLEYVVNRCGVVAGPFQMGKVDQGVIALWVASHYWKQDISYFGYGGKGKQVRDVLHIQDLFRLIDYEIHHFDQVDGSTFNAGGGLYSSVSLKELTTICRMVSGNKVSEHAVNETRTGDIPLYITDNSKIQALAGWEPQKKLMDIVQDVFDWIHKDSASLQKIFKR
jgi:CDP-paratose 2-epimerase